MGWRQGFWEEESKDKSRGRARGRLERMKLGCVGGCVLDDGGRTRATAGSKALETSAAATDTAPRPRNFHFPI
jgi:hypothetical protein